MTDWPDLLSRTYAVVRAPVALLDGGVLDDGLLDRSTPCSEWNLGQLFDHVVGAINMFATAAGAPPVDPPLPAASPVERFDAAVRRNLDAWSGFTDHGATLTLPFGEFPSDLVVAMNQLDALVHGWDLATALGRPVTLPDDLAERAMQTALVRVPKGRGHAWGSEVATGQPGIADRLIAYTGRDPLARVGAA